MVTLVVSLMACEDKVTSPPPEKQPLWQIKPDSMNLGILVLDYLTYKFEGGRLDYFAPCDTCDRDSIPCEVIYNPPVDFGDITFRYTVTGDTVLRATTVWMGVGRIVYPKEFHGPEQFQKLTSFAPEPTDFEYFWNSGRVDSFAGVDSAWATVRRLDIVHELAEGGYRAGIYLHGAGSAPSRPEHNNWVIFLWRGPREMP